MGFESPNTMDNFQEKAEKQTKLKKLVEKWTDLPNLESGEAESLIKEIVENSPNNEDQESIDEVKTALENKMEESAAEWDKKQAELKLEKLATLQKKMWESLGAKKVG